ncbi:hypothetical protein [Haloterrigena turkmenica]|nr:hypothetical protein [Haloterrigena turkmenica]
MSVVAEAVTSGELEDVERQLPDDEGYEQLFEIADEEEEHPA